MTRQTTYLRLATAVFVSLALSLLGCGSTTGNDAANDTAPGSDAASASDGADTSGSGGASTGHTSGTGGATDSGNTSATEGAVSTTTGGCVSGIPVTSQVPRLLNREYDAIIHDLLGISGLTAEGGLPPSSLLHADYEGELNIYSWNGYMEAANRIAEQVMTGDQRSRFMGCDPTLDDNCYEDTIRSFGRKIFRRPLMEPEVHRFMALTVADASWTPEQISEAILFAFLTSPSFILVPELSAEPEGSAFRRSNHEIATRLSLMLWGSAPDDELHQAADQGQLTTREQIRAQAERMILVRDKAGPQVSRAHEYYLRIAQGGSIWWSATHDPSRFPDFTDASKLALQGEVAAYFEEVAYEGGSFQDIFLSNIAFVNQDSAALYGLDPSEYDTGLARVELDATKRPGIFTRAGFLSSFSNYDATNPIRRGSFLAIYVFGVNPGPPDPDFIMPRVPSGEYTTQREKVEALTTADASCAACHELINPPGYVLEAFDAVGSWQDTDPLGGPIDPTADVTFADGSVRTMGSALELMQAIAADPMARHLYAQNLVSFFTGREPNGYDMCMVGEIATKLAFDGYHLLDVLVDLTQSDSFRLRIVGN